jgi:hypothetical protein
MAAESDAHPPAEVLRQFALGKSVGESSTTILSHLESCETCRERVASLSQQCEVDVTGVDVLWLRVRCLGSAWCARALWVEPKLSR